MSTLILRRLVGLCFFLLYFLLGVPLWYKLTTIYRASLPSKYIYKLHDDMNFDVHMVIPVYIKSDIYKFPDIHDAVQIQVDHLLSLRERTVNWSLQVLKFDENINDLTSEYIVDLKLDEYVSFNLPYDSKESTVFFNDETVASNDLPFFIAQTLVEHIFRLEWRNFDASWSDEYKIQDKNMAIQYDPNIHLSISLLIGDGNPVQWEIDSVLQMYFSPLRKFLSPLVNFTVDTNIVYFNDLNCHKLGSWKNITEKDLSHIIDLSELSSMNHYQEQIALNLAIVFPSNQTGSLSFIDFPGEYDWKSFLVPQWGVLIINKYPLPLNSKLTTEYLTPIMYNFSKEIFQLLGISKSSMDLLTPLITIESFKRLMCIRNLEKSINTLWSLVKMTDNLPQMAIPHEVLKNVTDALDLRLKIVELLNDPMKKGDSIWNQALLLSNQLVHICEAAFFHKEMVQQNFFPQEHSIAVYLPLLGPISIVIFLGFIRSMKEKEDVVPDNENKEHQE